MSILEFLYITRWNSTVLNLLSSTPPPLLNTISPSSLVLYPSSPTLLLALLHFLFLFPSVHCPSHRWSIRSCSLHGHCPRRTVPHPNPLRRKLSLHTAVLPPYPLPNCHTRCCTLLSLHIRSPRTSWHYSCILQVSTISSNEHLCRTQ